MVCFFFCLRINETIILVVLQNNLSFLSFFCIFFVFFFFAATKTTLLLTDSCNTTIKGRKDFKTKCKVMGCGCGSHMCDNVNKHIFSLPENRSIQDKAEKAQNSIKNTQYGAYTKDEILKIK